MLDSCLLFTNSHELVPCHISKVTSSFFEAKKPIGYITTGQNVPDDIRVPKKEEITRFILGEDSIC